MVLLVGQSLFSLSTTGFFLHNKFNIISLSKKRKIMRNLTIIIPLMLIANYAMTQNTNLDYKRAFKISNMTRYETFKSSTMLVDSVNSTVENKSSSLQLFHLTFAYQWKARKNNFHEIELIDLTVGRLAAKSEKKVDSLGIIQVLDGGRLSTSAISLRYEYIVNFNKSKDRKFVPSLGFGINPYFTHARFSPVVASSFPSSQKIIGFKVFINPRITYYVTSKFFVDLNIPICVLDNNLTVNKTRNPIISSSQSTISTYNFSQFPKVFNARIGIGLKIG
jgi:hypothetical protein